ncbi:MAG TPA: hypothetical protein PLU13_10020, partial [Thermomonas sp.]|nr:hypothetical protein [Thermomonas sp.]
GGHARNDRGPDKVNLQDILEHKWQSLGALASDNPKAILKQIGTLEKKSAKDVASLYDFAMKPAGVGRNGPATSPSPMV